MSKDTKNDEIRLLKYKLLTYLSDNNINVLEPNFSIINGITYPILTRALTIGQYYQTKLINQLVKEGYLSPILVDKVIRCPKCKSYRVITRYHCPSCGSFNIDKVSLISHKICGYIGTDKEFLVKDNQLICPKCKQVLKEGEYTVMGRVLECLDCKLRFDQPVIKHKCLQCGHEFDVLEADYVPVYKYNVKLNIIREHIGEITMELLRVTLSSLGFRLVDRVITGKSGIMHTFDIVAQRDDLKVGIDIIPIGIESQNLFRTLAVSFGKIIDIIGVKMILAIPENLKGNIPHIPYNPKDVVTIFYRKISDLPKLLQSAILEFERRSRKERELKAKEAKKETQSGSTGAIKRETSGTKTA